jgi:hypothetical protein
MSEAVLFRKLERNAQGFVLACASELVGAICHDVSAPKPDYPLVPRGQWYCQYSDCVVREVEVRCKLYGEKLPVMRCPACRQRLKFHHWLRHETWLRVQAPAPAPKEDTP